MNPHRKPMVEVRRDAVHFDDPAAAAGNSVGILQPGGTTA
jgi:hypothetical protein